MAASSPNRFLTFGRYLMLAAGLTVAVLLAAYLLLPIIAERLVVPRIFAAAGIAEHALPVQRLGLFGLRAGPLRIGPEKAPGIYVTALSAAYAPLDLLQGRIARVDLEGVRIVVRKGADGGIRIAGLPLPPPVAAEAAGDSLAPPPVAVGAIELTRGEVVFQQGERDLRLPFEAVIAPEADMTAFDGRLRLSVAGQRLTVKARIETAANRFAAEGRADGIQVGVLGRLAGLTPPLITGTGQFQGRLAGPLSPFAIDHLEATFRHSPCRLYWRTTRLDLAGATPREAIEVRIRSINREQWRVESLPLQVRLPGAVSRFKVEGTLGLDNGGGLAWQGSLAGEVATDSPGAALPGFRLPLALATAARRQADGRWQARFEHAPSNASAAPSEGDPQPEVIRLSPTLLEASAEGGGASWAADLKWRFADVQATVAGQQIALGAVEGTAHYRTPASPGDGRLALSLNPVTVRGTHFTARLKRLSLEVEGIIDPAAPPRIEGLVRISGGQVRLAEPAISAGGFNARLPLAWPPPAKGAPGEFALASLEWEGRALGRIDGRLRQVDQELNLTARHTSQLLPGLEVSAEGRAGLAADGRRPVARVHWSAERPAEAPPLTLSALMPRPPEFPITLEGRLFARGEVAYAGGLAGSLTAGLQDGRLQVDENGLVIAGIATELNLPDIGDLRSAPAQELVFEAVSFGDLRAEDGQLAYQLEPGGVLFLEGGRFGWSGGSVIAPATRFRPGENRYDLAFFCDRLQLDRLLEQLGMARAEGGGAISGLIPVALEDGLVTFDNAFLYSTPGEGGVIRVQGSEVLTAGIPPGTPQYNQMELARYALKDYDYDWAKITLDTVDENLLVQLQFDGKPAEPLPFVYDAEAGGFVKTAPDQPGSVFQGIRLDVNVTLPLNRMLRYRDLFKRLQ